MKKENKIVFFNMLPLHFLACNIGEFSPKSSYLYLQIHEMMERCKVPVRKERIQVAWQWRENKGNGQMESPKQSLVVFLGPQIR